MLLRINAKCKGGNTSDHELIDILRAMSAQKRDTVIGRYWRLSDLDIWPYIPAKTFSEEVPAMFPELGPDAGTGCIVVEGERLMERAALIHQLEVGWFARIVDTSQPVEPIPDYRLWQGPPTFQATNVDLEIRCDESPYEVVTADEGIIAGLQFRFAETELVVL